MSDNKIELKNAVLTWNVGGKVKVMPRTENGAFLERWVYWSIHAGEDKRPWVTQCFADAMACIVRDGCSPREVHREMMKIKEYADHMAVDAQDSFVGTDNHGVLQ